MDKKYSRWFNRNLWNQNVYELIELLDINLIKRTMCENKKGRFLRNEFGDEFIFVSDDLSKRE